MKYEINNTMSVNLIDKVTEKTIFSVDNVSCDTDLKVIQNDKSSCQKIYPRNISVTLNIKDNNFGEILKIIDESTAYKIMGNVSYMSNKDILLAKYFGVEIYPIRHNKNKRIQKKWNKRYGHKIICKKVKVNIENL